MGLEVLIVVDTDTADRISSSDLEILFEKAKIKKDQVILIAGRQESVAYWRNHFRLLGRPIRLQTTQIKRDITQWIERNPKFGEAVVFSNDIETVLCIDFVLPVRAVIKKHGKKFPGVPNLQIPDDLVFKTPAKTTEKKNGVKRQECQIPRSDRGQRRLICELFAGKKTFEQSRMLFALKETAKKAGCSDKTGKDLYGELVGFGVLTKNGNMLKISARGAEKWVNLGYPGTGYTLDQAMNNVNPVAMFLDRAIPKLKEPTPRTL